MSQAEYVVDLYHANLRRFDAYCKAREHTDLEQNSFIEPYLDTKLNVPFDWDLKHLNGWENPFGYTGARVHVIVTPKREVLRFTDLASEEWAEVPRAQAYVSERYGARGLIFLYRDGHPTYTGASIAQWHGHFIVPELGQSCVAYFSKSHEGQAAAVKDLAAFKQKHARGDREWPVPPTRKFT